MGETGTEAARIPDGISESSLGDGGSVRNLATPMVALALALLIGAAMTGWLAGRPNPTKTLRTPAATLSVNAPDRLRSGQFFEVRMTATAHRDLTDFVIAVPPALWRDWTVNTMIPGPAEESFEDGRFTLHFGEVKAGDSFEIKVDAQLNPSLFGGTNGTILLRDGDMSLGELPLATRVLP